MADKYNRTICGFCPDKAECEVLQADSVTSSAAWAVLPRKCLLAESLLARHVRGVVTIPLCPRCGSSACEVQIDRDWKIKLGGVLTKTNYTLHCSHCALDALEIV